jgi:hypothetical protein
MKPFNIKTRVGSACDYFINREDNPMRFKIGDIIENEMGKRARIVNGRDTETFRLLWLESYVVSSSISKASDYWGTVSLVEDKQ